MLIGSIAELRINGCKTSFVTIILIMLAVSRTGAAEDMSLELTAQPPARGSEVRFLAKPNGIVPVSSLSDSSLVPSARTAHGYVVEVDSSSYRQDKNHRYLIDVYVPLRADDPNSDLYKFLVWEDQAGKFSDSWSNITVGITYKGISESTSIRLPIHCIDSENLQVDSSKPLPVGMGNESTMTLGVKNALTDLHVAVQSPSEIIVEDRSCPSCWLSLKGKIPRANLTQGAGTTLDIDLQPNTLKLLRQNFWPPAADAPPNVLMVTIISASDKGGFDVSQEFAIPIRFTPAPLHIALMLICGALLGLVLRVWITKKVDWVDFAIQFLIALVVWAILLATKAKASMFGYDFDPTSLIASGLLTLIIVGGSPVVDKITDAIKRIKP